jgi:hypothetical protein
MAWQQADKGQLVTESYFLSQHTEYSKTGNAAHDMYKSAPNIRKKWPRYKKKKFRKIITGHGEKKILRSVQ